jgi:IS4 transposase
MIQFDYAEMREVAAHAFASMARRYPGLVSRKRLHQKEADRRMRVMAAIVALLRELEKTDRLPNL